MRRLESSPKTSIVRTAIPLNDFATHQNCTLVRSSLAKDKAVSPVLIRRHWHVAMIWVDSWTVGNAHGNGWNCLTSPNSYNLTPSPDVSMHLIPFIPFPKIWHPHVVSTSFQERFHDATVASPGSGPLNLARNTGRFKH